MNLSRLIEHIQSRDANIGVQADLTINVGQTRIHCQGDGQCIYLNLQSFDDLFSLYLDRQPGQLKHLDKAIFALGLTIKVRVSNRVIVTVGKQANPGFWAYCTSLDRIQLHFGAFSKELLKYLNPFSSGDT